jgi:hypothetical protein
MLHKMDFVKVVIVELKFLIKYLEPRIKNKCVFEGFMIFHIVLSFASHSSNVREGVKLQKQISYEEIVVLNTLLAFEDIQFFDCM